eukprot:jgi/Ulvmu1/5020/UM021_0037.1
MAIWIVEGVYFKCLVQFVLRLIAETAIAAGFGRPTWTPQGLVAEGWSVSVEGGPRARLVLHCKDDELGEKVSRAIHGHPAPSSKRSASRTRKGHMTPTVRRATPLEIGATIQLAGCDLSKEDVVKECSRYGQVARVDICRLPPQHPWAMKLSNDSARPYLINARPMQVTRVTMASAADAARIVEAAADLPAELGTPTPAAETPLAGPQVILTGGRDLVLSHLPEILEAAPHIAGQKVFWDPLGAVFNRLLEFHTLEAADHFMRTMHARGRFGGHRFGANYYNPGVTGVAGMQHWLPVWDTSAQTCVMLPPSARVGDDAATARIIQGVVAQANRGLDNCANIVQPYWGSAIFVIYNSSDALAKAMRAFKACGGPLAAARPLDAFGVPPQHPYPSVSLPPPPPFVRTKGKASAGAGERGSAKMGASAPESAASSRIEAIFMSSPVKGSSHAATAVA